MNFLVLKISFSFAKVFDEIGHSRKKKKTSFLVKWNCWDIRDGRIYVCMLLEVRVVRRRFTQSACCLFESIFDIGLQHLNKIVLGKVLVFTSRKTVV